MLIKSVERIKKQENIDISEVTKEFDIGTPYDSSYIACQFRIMKDRRKCQIDKDNSAYNDRDFQ